MTVNDTVRMMTNQQNNRDDAYYDKYNKFTIYRRITGPITVQNRQFIKIEKEFFQFLLG